MVPCQEFVEFRCCLRRSARSLKKRRGHHTVGPDEPHRRYRLHRRGGHPHHRLGHRLRDLVARPLTRFHAVGAVAKPSTSRTSPHCAANCCSGWRSCSPTAWTPPAATSWPTASDSDSASPWRSRPVRRHRGGARAADRRTQHHRHHDRVIAHTEYGHEIPDQIHRQREVCERAPQPDADPGRHRRIDGQPLQEPHQIRQPPHISGTDTVDPGSPQDHDSRQDHDQRHRLHRHPCRYAEESRPPHCIG